jgi:DNA-directed RNA polymerase specialized sigma24 family protein
LSAATQLLERCLAGDHGAIEAVFQTYQRPVFRLAYATLLEPGQAGRAMQAGLNSVLGALRPGMTEEEFQVLLFQHVLKACRAERRRVLLAERLAILRIANRIGRKKYGALRAAGANGGPAGEDRALPVGAPHPLEAPVDSYPDVPARRRAGLWQAIGRLTEEQRVALVLRYEFDLPLAVAARVLRSSPGAVHARLTAARRVLGEAFEALQAGEARP